MKNLKISTKIYTFVCLGLLFFGFVLSQGIIKMKDMRAESSKTETALIPAMDLILQIDRDLQQAIVAERSLLQLEQNSDTYKKQHKDHSDNLKQVLERFEKYEKLIFDENERAESSKFIPLVNKWMQLSRQIVAQSANKTVETKILLNTSLTDGTTAFEAARDIIDKLGEYKEKQINEYSEHIGTSYESSLTEYSIYGAVMLLMIIPMSIVLVRSLKKPINELNEAAENIAKGNLAFTINIDQSDEIGELAESFKAMQYNLKSLNSEIADLISHSVVGELGKRADSSKFSGDYKKMVDGINNTLDNIIEPLSLTAEFLDRIAKGDIPDLIEEEFQGDFNEIINNLNLAINSINSMLYDANALAAAASEGSLNKRANLEDHQGAYRNIIAGINETLDNLIEPIHKTSTYLTRVSKGELPENISYEFKGDFNEIKTSLITCISAINKMYEDANHLIEAAKLGKLNTRTDISLHSGKYAEIITGVNQILDLAEGSLNLSSNVMIGDADFNITYMNKSVYNLLSSLEKEIKVKYPDFSVDHLIGRSIDGFHKNPGYNRNLLDKMVKPHTATINVDKEFFKLTISPRNDANGVRLGYLVEWHRITEELNFENELKETISNLTNGVLKHRMNAVLFDGKNLETVNSINKMLDEIISPLNVAAKYMQRIAEGDIPATITQDYYGDFNEIKTNINTCIDAINTLVSDSKMLSRAAIEGKLSIRADVSKHQGDFRAIVEGVNHTLDSVIGPLNVAAEYVDRISKGDIPTKITDDYNGDFNEIKNNLNTCIDAVETLVNDTKMLAKAAMNGQLSTRANADNHNGDFRVIVDGINTTLDNVINPITEAGNVLAEIANGDLTVQMTGEYKGDLNTLKASINQLVTSLDSVISKVTESVHTTSSTALELSSTAETMAAAAQEQSSQADEVASAVEEMSHTVSENANSAGRTAHVAEKNGEVAREGGKVVEQTIKKMRDISVVVSNSAANIEKLGESSKEIGEIISVIDDIADQTNLLALNAAIEAARAGEQGRGFAVVADEVRKLAERTTEATKQIANMIKSIQSETQDAVLAMKKGTDEVTAGIEFADRAGDSLRQVVASSQEVLDMINQIAAASEEQSATTEQISKNVLSISKVTAESAHRIEDIAHSSDDLTKLTEHLNELVSQFHTSNPQQGGSRMKLSSQRQGKGLPGY